MKSADVAIAGGGVGGLLGAAAVASAGGSCVVIERDPASAGPEVRRGVPQGSQLHNVLSRGQRSLEMLLPGILDELVDAGACIASVGDQTVVFEYGAPMPRRPLGLHILSASQPVIEATVRRRVAALPGVDLLGGASVTDLMLDGERATGLVTDDPGVGPVHAGIAVIDATGASARALAWVEQRGWSTPRVDAVVRGRWYASAVVTRPDEWLGDPTFRMWFPSEPSGRGVLMSPAGPDRWYLSANGSEPHQPPHDARGLIDHCTEVTSGSDPSVPVDPSAVVSAVNVYRRPVARWRRWDLWEQPIDGLLVLGDAVATLDPLQGQGLSVAAWHAAHLLDCFASLGAGTRPIQMEIATRTRAAWELPERMDAAIGSIAGETVSLVERLQQDAELHRRYVECWHLLRDPQDLMVEDPLRASA